MTDDPRDLRARRLLRIGSDPEADAPGAAPSGLRPGFMERLRARLAAEERQAAEGWTDALATLSRPALGMACAAVIIAGALLLLSPAVPSEPGERDEGDTLAALVEDSSTLGTLLDGGRGSLWSAIDANGDTAGGAD